MYYNTVMEKIKEPSVAGTFYPNDTVDLINLIETFKQNSKNYYNYPARAVIVPHAGLIFSGRLAYEGISQLDKNIKTLFIIAPAHRISFEGLALSSYDKWKTPLGDIEVNQDINRGLASEFGANYNDSTISPEHSLEVEVPVIQSVFEDVKIVPILIGSGVRPGDIAKIVAKYYENKENGFIISSDLSHFLDDNKAKELDYTTARMIETGDIRNFQYEMACGAIGVTGLVEFANLNKYSMLRIDMTNSGEVTGDKSRVVGYGTWFLYEGDKNEFIKTYHSDFVIGLCKTVIKSAFNREPVTLLYPQVFDEPGACFVTLEQDGQLRGCIGSLLAHRSLANDLVENAKNAAFNDPRFRPVDAIEAERIKVNVSLLSIPRQIAFDGEEDLLNKITPNLDGIIIKDGNRQATFLPSVWEQIPDKREFLIALKQKAGFSADYFSPTFEAYRYETIYIKEDDLEQESEN